MFSSSTSAALMAALRASSPFIKAFPAAAFASLKFHVHTAIGPSITGVDLS